MEQAGIRVIPIDYNLPVDEIKELLEQINGLYIPGDSQLAVTDSKYKEAFLTAMMYSEAQSYDYHEHFPVFLMGNSLQTYVRSKQQISGSVSEMKNLKHTNSRIEMAVHPDDTFLFNNFDREKKQAMFNTGQFFNM